MTSKFKFYEIVNIKPEVVSQENKLRDLGKITGVIAGMSHNDEGEWGYGVFLEATETVWHFEEDELESTGKFAPEDYNTSGESITVVVSPDGKGSIKEDD